MFSFWEHQQFMLWNGSESWGLHHLHEIEVLVRRKAQARQAAFPFPASQTCTSWKSVMGLQDLSPSSITVICETLKTWGLPPQWLGIETRLKLNLLEFISYFLTGGFLCCFSQHVQWKGRWNVTNPWQKTRWDELGQRSVVSLVEISTSICNLWKHMKQSIFHLKTLQDTSAVSNNFCFSFYLWILHFLSILGPYAATSVHLLVRAKHVRSLACWKWEVSASQTMSELKLTF